MWRAPGSRVTSAWFEANRDLKAASEERGEDKDKDGRG